MERLWSRAVATGGNRWQMRQRRNGSDSRKPLPWVATVCRRPPLCCGGGHFPSSAKRGGVPRAEDPEARVPTLIFQPEIVILPVRAAPWVRLGRLGGRLSLLGPASGPLPQLEPVAVGVQGRDADAVGIVHGLWFHERHAAGPQFLEVLAQVVGP